MPWTRLILLGVVLLALNLAIGSRSSFFRSPQLETPEHGALASDLPPPAKALEISPATQDDLRQAQNILTQQLADLRIRHPDGHQDIVTVLMQLGKIQTLREQHGHACDSYQEALDLQASLLGGTPLDGHPELAEIHDQLSVSHFRNREFVESGRHANYALEVLRKAYDPERYPNGHADLARGLWRLAFMRGGDQHATELYREALAMQKFHYPDGHTDTVITLMDLGNALTNLGEIEEAATYYTECVELLEELNELETFQGATTTQYLGRHALRLGRLDSAIQHFREAVRIFEVIFPEEYYPHGHDHLAHGLLELATALRLAGHNEQAAEHAEKAEAMKLWRAAAHVAHVSQAEALNYTSFQLASPDLLLSLWPETKRTTASLYEYVWQRKGLIQRAQSNRLRKAMQSATPEMRRKYDEYREVLKELAEAAYLPGNDRGEARQQRYDRLQDLTQQKESLERQLARELPKFQYHLSDSIGVHHTELTQRLPSGVAVLDFVRYRYIPTLAELNSEIDSTSDLYRYSAFLLTSNEPVKRIDLGSAESIDALASEWREAINDRPSEERTLAEMLSEQLWRPLVSQLPRDMRTLYIIPTGLLTKVPWPALPGEVSGTILLESFSLATLPHGHLLLEQLREAESDSAPSADRRPESSRTGRSRDSVTGSNGTMRRLLAVGDAAFHPPEDMAVREDEGRREEMGDESARDDVKDNSSENRLNGQELLGLWPELPGTAAEMEVLRQFRSTMETTFLTRHDATVRNAVIHLPQADYAHVATHGFHAAPNSEVQQFYDLLEDNLEAKPVPIRSAFTSRNPSLLSGLVLAFPTTDQSPGAKSQDRRERGTNPNTAPPRDVPNGGVASPRADEFEQRAGQILTAEEIAVLPLQNLKLVVLSACETGLGAQADSEGAFGLQRSFHQAGARNVVTCLWRVEDEATVALMRLFYEYLWEHNLRPIEALRQAQLKIYRDPDLATSVRSSQRGPRIVAGTPDREPAPTDAPPRSSRLRPERWAGFMLSGIGQ
jgi:CHAT domain-containing protein